MVPDEIERAKAVVLACPTRPRYRDDTEIVVRLNDVKQADRVLVRRFAIEVGVPVRESGFESIRPSESMPLVGDVEYAFPTEMLE